MKEFLSWSVFLCSDYKNSGGLFDSAIVERIPEVRR
jgi:hypothetical protein